MDNGQAEEEYCGNADAVGDCDSGGGVHEERFRDNVDQQVCRWVQHPKVIVEKYFEKFVDMIVANAASRAKNRMVPAQMVRGST